MFKSFSGSKEIQFHAQPRRPRSKKTPSRLRAFAPSRVPFWFRLCRAAFFALALAPAGTSAAGQNLPPKIALVLSGGGARGAAHIGVLKVFEREKIPIDAIVGTSFGALVGGLYAQGYSPEEIEGVFAGGAWTGVFSNAPDRAIAPFPAASAVRYQGEIHFKRYIPELPSGLLVGQRLIEFLDRLTTERMVAADFDFDKLAYRFRAVSTNLADGHRYVFRNGSMTDAIRASIAIPLLFSPVVKDQMLLADGGLVDNLPTDVARELGADIVIAVDVTSPLLEKEQIKTFLQVMDQSISLLMRRNVEENLKLADVVLRPDLAQYPSTDYTRIPEIVKRGVEIAENRLPELKALLARVPPRGPHPIPTLPIAPAIVSVSFEGLKEVSSGQLRKEISAQAGRHLDVNILVKDLRRLHAGGLFERADFKLIPAGQNSYHLVYAVQESAMRTLGAAIRYDRDYGFSALAEFRARQLFHTPSTLTLSTQFGGVENYYASLQYVPSSRRAFFYIAPQVHYSARSHPDFSNGELVDRFNYKQAGGQLMVGTGFRRTAIEIGYRMDRATIEGGTPPFAQSGPLQLRGLRLNLNRNTTDGNPIPNRGTLLSARADERRRAFGSEVGFSRYELDVAQYLPIAEKTNIQFFGSAGLSRGALPFYERFYLGGFSFSEGSPRRLIGFDFGELAAHQMVILGTAYRYRWFAQPFGFLKQAFVSGIYNAALVSERDRRPYNFDLFQGVGAEVTFDTLIGPLRLSAGWGQGGRINLYLSFGPVF